jgi:sodium-dependent dicarboxylate transporter 2/3/5
MVGEPSPLNPKSSAPSRGWLLVAFGLAGVAGYGLWAGAGVAREVAFMGGIFVLAAVLWITEALPLFATSLLVIGLQAILLANPGGWPGLGFAEGASPSYRTIFGAAADPVLVLFFGGFVLAHAAVKEGVDRAMSGLLLRPFGSEPSRVLLGVMLVTFLFGMWMSNTATATMMLALVAPMVASAPAGEPFRKALVLAVPLAANLSGITTPIASPPNAVAVGFLHDSGHQVPFLKWMLVAVPLALGLTLFAWWLLWKFFPPRTEGLGFEPARGKLSARGRIVVGVFVATVLLWMGEQWHGLPPAVVALFPAIALTVTGLFTGKDLGRLEWRILILIAGGISLGTGMQLTGMDRVLTRWLPVHGESGPWLLGVLVVATVVVGTFMSNTAAANLFLPVGIAATSAVEGGGLSPIQLAMSIAFAASMSMALPISTPPNALAHAQGEFTSRDLLKVTLILGAVAIVLILLGGGLVMRLCGVVE